MKAKTSITIKGQGSIALSQPKKVKVDTAHKPGRGKGAALRGNKFNGIF